MCVVFDKTPFEMWFGSKPDLSRLKIFGCVAYSHIPKELRSKLEKKSNILAFVGYGNCGYRLWDKTKNKVIVSRDVIFDESKSYFKDFGHETVPNKAGKDCVGISPAIVVTRQRDQPRNEPEIQNVLDPLIDLDVQNEIDVQSELDEPNAQNSSDKLNESDEPNESSISSDDEVFEEALADEIIEPVGNGRSERDRKPPFWMKDYETSFITGLDEIPQDIAKLKVRSYWHKWKQAIDDELCSLNENNTWTLVGTLPRRRKAINSMWVFSITHKKILL